MNSFLVFTYLQGLDLMTTFLGLKHPGTYEANPLARWFMGLVPDSPWMGGVLQKLLYLVTLWLVLDVLEAGDRIDVSKVITGMNVLFMFVVVNNLTNLF